jgi:hypothetical protein
MAIKVLLQIVLFGVLAVGSFLVVSRLRSVPAGNDVAEQEVVPATPPEVSESQAGPGSEPADARELRAMMEALSRAAAGRASAPAGRSLVDVPEKLSALQQLSTDASSTTGLTAGRVHGALQVALWQAARRCWTGEKEVGATTIRFRATVSTAADALAVSGVVIETTEGDELPPSVHECIDERVANIRQIMRHESDLGALGEGFVSHERVSLVIRGGRG